MIVRIQGEGQYELSDAAQAELDKQDDALFQAIEGNDDAAFRAALAAVTGYITSNGTKVADDRLVASDVIMPGSDTTLEEAKALFTDEGLLKPVEA